ncbi:MAG: hypothetical protein J6W30_01480 [Bacteroidales bacterium]|nr:hypothetical protein [Bacteroidales bacterium]
MNKILVFTNAKRWNQLKTEFEVDKALWNAQYDTIAEKLVLKYSIDNGTAVLENLPELSINEEGVYFVYDQIDGPRLNHLLEQCANDEAYALVHTEGVQKSNLGQDVIVLRGQHDTEDNNYYYPLFDILTTIEVGDTVAEKMRCIIDSTKFKFLDEAIEKFVIDFSEPNKKIGQFATYRILHQIDRFKKPMEDFRKKYETSKTRDEYIDDLIRLQELLLSGRP